MSVVCACVRACACACVRGACAYLFSFLRCSCDSRGHAQEAGTVHLPPAAADKVRLAAEELAEEQTWYDIELDD